MKPGVSSTHSNVIQQIQQDFPLKAPQVVYRYCEQRAEKAQEIVGKHYQQFIDYSGKATSHPNL